MIEWPVKSCQAVEQTIAIGAPGIGFILNTFDSIRPETPWENITAFIDAAHDFAGKA